MNAPPFQPADHPPPPRRRRDVAPTLPVVLGLPEIEAAGTVGVSVTKFREMVERGLMPQPRDAAGKLVYDVDELRAAFKALPHRGEDVEGEADTWADVKPKAASVG